MYELKFRDGTQDLCLNQLLTSSVSGVRKMILNVMYEVIHGLLTGIGQ